MAEDSSRRKPRALLVDLAAEEFTTEVRHLSEQFFEIFESDKSATRLSYFEKKDDLDLDGSIIVAFSDADYDDPSLISVTHLLERFPENQVFFVVPDGRRADVLEPFLKEKAGRGYGLVFPLLKFAQFLGEEFSEEYVEGVHGREGLASAETFGGDGEAIPDEITFTFDPSLTPQQIKATLTAFAKYYRACGGVGLPAEFETQEAEVLEDAHV